MSCLTLFVLHKSHCEERRTEPIPELFGNGFRYAGGRVHNLPGSVFSIAQRKSQGMNSGAAWNTVGWLSENFLCSTENAPWRI